MAANSGPTTDVKSPRSRPLRRPAMRPESKPELAIHSRRRASTQQNQIDGRPHRQRVQRMQRPEGKKSAAQTRRCVAVQPYNTQHTVLW